MISRPIVEMYPGLRSHIQDLDYKIEFPNRVPSMILRTREMFARNIARQVATLDRMQKEFKSIMEAKLPETKAAEQA